MAAELAAAAASPTAAFEGVARFRDLQPDLRRPLRDQGPQDFDHVELGVGLRRKHALEAEASGARRLVLDSWRRLPPPKASSSAELCSPPRETLQTANDAPAGARQRRYHWRAKEK
jgi:hypothetical protein